MSLPPRPAGPHSHPGPAETHPARRSRLLALALSADVLIAAGLLGLLGLTSATAPRWSRFLRQPLPAGESDGYVPDSAPAPAASAAQRTIQVKLFFEVRQGDGLTVEERAVPFSPDLAHQVELLVEALLAGPQGDLVAPLPPEARVLGAFVTRSGVAYVNLSKEAQAVLVGSHAELLSVFALVNSVTANLPAVKRVQILIDGRPADTLAGHVDLGRPLAADMSLLAVMDLVPVGGPGPAATPPASPSPTAAPASPPAAAGSPVPSR